MPDWANPVLTLLSKKGSADSVSEVTSGPNDHVGADTSVVTPGMETSVSCAGVGTFSAPRSTAGIGDDPPFSVAAWSCAISRASLASHLARSTSTARRCSNSLSFLVRDASALTLSQVSSSSQHLTAPHGLPSLDCGDSLSSPAADVCTPLPAHLSSGCRLAPARTAPSAFVRTSADRSASAARSGRAFRSLQF